MLKKLLKDITCSGVLVVWNREMYNARHYKKIYRTRDNKVILDSGELILRMCIVPRSVLMD